MDEDRKKELASVAKDILRLFQERKVRISEASGILGAVFASIAIKTEENFPFVSFLNSFTRSYSVNYDGTEIHELAGPYKSEDL